ncbi:MAG: hypothetical protein PHD73_05625 [Sediminibacterium sp.]|nr:hypothetical protein [Sediminibacterium sp.]
MHKFKKISAAGLLAIPLIPLFVLFSLEMARIINRREIRAQMEVAVLQKIVLPEKDINWVEEGRELSIDGNMFDVQQINRLPDGMIELTGVFDERETQLNKELDMHLKMKGVHKAILSTIASIQAVVADPVESEAPVLSEITNSFSTADHFSLCPFKGEVITPPPQLLRMF